MTDATDVVDAVGLVIHLEEWVVIVKGAAALVEVENNSYDLVRQAKILRKLYNFIRLVLHKGIRGSSIISIFIAI